MSKQNIMAFETDISVIDVAGSGRKKSRSVSLVSWVPIVVILFAFQVFIWLTFRPDQTSQMYEVLLLPSISSKIIGDFKIDDIVPIQSTNANGTSTKTESKPDTKTTDNLVPTTNVSENSSTIDSKEGMKGTLPLNIVVFFPDDMSHKSLQDVSGPGYVETPFLSALAKDGIRFARNAVTTSVCWMSRATLFTGLYCKSAETLLL